MDPTLEDSEDAVTGPLDKRAARALRPAHGQFHRAFDRLVRRGIRRALVQRHRNVGAEQVLDRDRPFRRQLVEAAVEMRAKGDAGLGDGPARRQ